MTANRNANGHHESAARHHEQAAHFHREASRHYQIGKDYAHAAHMALTARGHALRAMQNGQAASEQYAEHDGSPLPTYLTRSPINPSSTEVAAAMSMVGWSLHAVAAEHHDAGRRHHAQAEQHGAADHYVRANYETKKALDHAKHALFHGDAAALYHQEHCGSHPVAELA